MKGLFGPCFPLLFLLLQGGYSEEQKYGYFHVNFEISPNKTPIFEPVDPQVYENRGCWADESNRCNLTLELCFIGQKPSQRYFSMDLENKPSFESCENANSTVKSYTLIVRKTETGAINTEKCTLNQKKPSKILKEHARGNEIHMFAKLIFPKKDDAGHQSLSMEGTGHQLKGNLDAGHPHHVNYKFSKVPLKESDKEHRVVEVEYVEEEDEKVSSLRVEGTLQLICEENWHGCWCDQFCYEKAIHYECDNFGKKICKKGFFPERGDLDLCRGKDPSTAPCQNYCLFEKLDEGAETESCDACGYKTCTDFIAYDYDDTTNSCEKRTCTWPHTIYCFPHYVIYSGRIDCENDPDGEKNEGTGVYFKCKCDGDKKTKRDAFISDRYYCESSPISPEG